MSRTGRFALRLPLGSRVRAHPICGKLAGPPPACTDLADWHTWIAGCPPLAYNATALHSRLYDEQQIALPLIDWNDRQVVRVLAQGYNARGDLEALAEALGTLAGRTGAGRAIRESRITTGI